MPPKRSQSKYPPQPPSKKDPRTYIDRRSPTPTEVAPTPPVQSFSSQNYLKNHSTRSFSWNPRSFSQRILRHHSSLNEKQICNIVSTSTMFELLSTGLRFWKAHWQKLTCMNSSVGGWQPRLSSIVQSVIVKWSLVLRASSLVPPLDMPRFDANFVALSKSLQL